MCIKKIKCWLFAALDSSTIDRCWGGRADVEIVSDKALAGG